MFRVFNKFNNQLLFKSIINRTTPIKLNYFKKCDNKIVSSPIGDNSNQFTIMIKDKFKQQLNYYSTKKTTTDLPTPRNKTEEMITKKLSEKGGVDELISKYLQIIDSTMNSEKGVPEDTYLTLFMLMKLNGEMETITLLNGETYSRKYILVKEIHISKDKHFHAWFELGKLLNSSGDHITLPTGHAKKPFGEYDRLDVFVKCFEMDNTNAIVLDEITTLMMNKSIRAITLFNNEIKTILELCILNYQFNRKTFSKSWINLSKNIGYIERVEIDGETVDSTLLLINGVLLFPSESRFYYQIATEKLKNNIFPISKFRTLPIDHPFANKNRLQLLVNAIEIEEAKEYPSELNLSEYYYHLGAFISNKESTVTISGVEMTKLQCFSKCLKIDPLLLSNQFLLATSMKPDEIVLVGGESVTKKNVVYSLLYFSRKCGIDQFNQFSYKNLSILENTEESRNKYKKLLSKENKIQVKSIINEIEVYNNTQPLIELAEIYKRLYLIIQDSQGFSNKPINHVTINGEKQTKIDILLKAVGLNHKGVDQFYYLSQELQLPINGDSTGTEIKSEQQSKDESNLSIKILSGQEFTKLQLIDLELGNNPASSLAYHSLAAIMPDTFEKANAKLTTFIISLSFDENNSKAYFEIGKSLTIHSIDSIEISGINYTRKQLFIKSLETEDPSDKLNGKNLLTLYYLFKEQPMDDTTILYNGKTSNQIKNEIVLNLKQELSTLTIDKNINKQKLLNLL